jgi:hypothetical protein
MTPVRDRIPAEPEYLQALGRAAYNFTYLEWGIVWLGETLLDGFIGWCSKQTAQQIGERFAKLARAVPPDDDDREALICIAGKFLTLVLDRNRLLHAHPYTATDGEQRLGYRGKSEPKDWPKSEIEMFADDVSDLSSHVTSAFYGGRYETWKARQ